MVEKMKHIIERIFSLLLVLCLTSCVAFADSFTEQTEEKYISPDVTYKPEVRWWMAEAGHTDKTIVEEITSMHDAGFRGFELCQHVEGNIDESEYGYGSEQWDHDMRLALNTALDLGMTVSMTSGTNWATANIPGLDPHSQAASQIVLDIVETVKPGESRTGALPAGKKVGSKTVPVDENAKLIGVFAVPQVSGSKSKPVTTDASGIIELTDLIITAKDGSQTLDWTPENPDNKYRIFFYYQQGACQDAHPAQTPAYCINYFDQSGEKALEKYWTEHILNDPELNKKIATGDVQLFMDSLEINVEDGCAFWSDDMAEEFLARKGYDIRPYLYLTIGLPPLSYWDAKSYGTYDIDGNKDLRKRILNDLFDVQTELYRERMLEPLADFLHGYGIKTRAQISYGQRLEISEPIMSVDYPEAEVLNQNNQVDIYRIWTGGSKLQNKVLSAEAGAYGGYHYSYQDHLYEAYNLFAAGFGRIIWHVWTAQYGPGANNTWPYYRIPGAIYSNFYSFGTHEPSSADYPAFTSHLARISRLLQEGKSRTDIGMLYINYQQPTPTMGNHGGENWMLNHTTALFPDTSLQDNGYTYDYFSPAFLNSEGVSFNKETGTLEQAGYKALVIWQEQLTLDGAKSILELAKQGMKIVVVDGAAVKTPYNDNCDNELSETISQLEALPNCKVAASCSDVLQALQEMGVEPYCGYSHSNRQLLTQMRQDQDEAYLYVYNYCDGSYIPYFSKGESADTHGDSITTELEIEGTWIPFSIDAWTGKTTELGCYRHENGKTIFPISLDYGNVKLYAFEKSEDAHLHAVSSTCSDIYAEGDNLIARMTENGTYTATLSDGTVKEFTCQVPEKFEITDWDVEFSLRTPSEESAERTETLFGSSITETQVQTVINSVNLHLDHLKPWDEITELDKAAVGQALYTAKFDWDGTCDGAYLDLGDICESARVVVNGESCGDLSMTDPVIDISSHLRHGENTISILYSSNLVNYFGGNNPGDWYGYRYGMQKYGIAHAELIPWKTVSLK